MRWEAFHFFRNASPLSRFSFHDTRLFRSREGGAPPVRPHPKTLIISGSKVRCPVHAFGMFNSVIKRLLYGFTEEVKKQMRALENDGKA